MSALGHKEQREDPPDTGHVATTKFEARPVLHWVMLAMKYPAGHTPQTPVNSGLNPLTLAVTPDEAPGGQDSSDWISISGVEQKLVWHTAPDVDVSWAALVPSQQPVESSAD